MSDKHTDNLPFEGNNAAEDKMWQSLAELAQEEPSASLRQGFYSKLERATRPTVIDKLRELLGFSGNAGWITAAACTLLGLAAGQMLGNPATDDEDLRLAALEQNVSTLNRSLILDRLENDTASKRLRGIMDASLLVGEDAEIAQALLQRATDDRVYSVRSAAIQALGPQLAAPTVGDQLMELLQQSDAPLVQLALADLVLRNGSEQQISELLRLAKGGALHPDLARHVLTSLQREVV